MPTTTVDCPSSNGAIQQPPKIHAATTYLTGCPKRRITYRIPDPTELERPDLWCCRIGDRDFMTSSKTELERVMDQAQQRGDHVGTPVLVRWHGKVRHNARRESEVLA